MTRMKTIVGWILVLGFVSSPAWSQVRNYNIPPRNTPTTNSVDYSQPQEYEIGGITVSGAQYLDKNALISLSGLQVGDKISVPGQAISQAIEKLWSQGLLEDVQIYATKIELGKIYLNIELKELPRLTRYTFEGISTTLEKEIDDEIELLRGRIITDALIKNTRLVVEDYFKDKGYRNVGVTITPEADSLITNGRALRIKIDRGRKVRIDRINIIGNEAFSDVRLKFKIKKTKEAVRFNIFEDMVGRLFRGKFEDLKYFDADSSKFSVEDFIAYAGYHVKLNFFQGSKLVASQYDEDFDGIIAFYNSKGYRDAEILRDTIYDIANNRINVDVYLDEGPRYYIRNVTWSGNFLYSDEELSGLLGIEKGEVYNKDRIDKRLQFDPQERDISSLYQDDGYLFFGVTPVEVGVYGDSIDIEMQMYEGQQATIDRIIVEGNDRTKDHVILREIRTLPGQKFSRANLIRTQRELSNLGYFDPEQMGISPIPNQAEGTVDIKYQLVERPNDQIELSGGWGGFAGFVGTVGLVFNNFSAKNIFNFDKWDPLPVGDGQRFAIRAQANGRQYQNYSITFAEPWLGGRRPNSLSVSANRSVIRSLYPFQLDSVLGTFAVSGITVGLGRRARWPDDFFLVNNSISYQAYQVSGQSTFVGTQLGFKDGVAHSVTINQTISRNSVDNPMFPRSGSNVTLSATLTPPHSLWRGDLSGEDAATQFKWVEYHKWMLDVWHYEELADKLVLNARAHMGFLGRYTPNTILGPFERFVLGGDGITAQNFNIGQDNIGLRGYPNQSLTPPYGTTDPNAINGGVAFTKYVLELRYGISLEQAATIYILGFLEAGNNFSNYDNYSPFRLYRSAGLGARVFMPAFGLLGVDWGYGFDNIPGTNSRSGSQFHFSIGQPIR